ncbi:MAG TPA: class I SAM-dependent methyltransferase [Usitatibacter sp.]|nr:class I SAM-dependent methyltransferase [Usitatibacter sp.]
MKPRMGADYDREAIKYWDERSCNWQVAAPISPQDGDIRFYEARAAGSAQGEQPLRALLLGVTPPVAGMRWPDATRLVVLDWSAGMFRNVFPRWNAPSRCGLVRGDWRQMPLAPASFDFVVGDGCYSTFGDARGPVLLNEEAARVLRPGGEFCLRCHRRPDTPPAIDALFKPLLDGRMRNLDMFRWLLAMAAHGEASEGIRLGDVWEAWHAHVPDVSAAQQRLGWTHQAVANMERWKGAATRYFFPSLAQLHEFAGAHFEVESCELPNYAWGEHFPRLVLRRRQP